MPLKINTISIFRPAYIAICIMLGSSLKANEEMTPSAVNKPKLTEASPSPEQLPKSSLQGIVLKSDRSKMDGKTGMFEYCGNALLTQPELRISAQCLTGKRQSDGSYEYVLASGNPAKLIQVNEQKKESLVVSANNIRYKISNQFFDISGKADLKIENKTSMDSLRIKALRIELDNKNFENRKIRANGKPLEIELIKSGETDLKAKSKKLSFSTGNSNLQLTEEVIANLKLGEITAGIFNYNSETKVSSFEKSNNEQVEIIQTKKQ